MHEMSIAVALLDQLEQLAAEHGGTRIEAFTVTAGEMRCIVPEALQIAFETIAENSTAQGAVMTLQIEAVLAQCRRCGHHFSPRPQDFQCPRCNQADVDFIQGNDIVISSMTIEQPGEVDHGNQCSAQRTQSE